jgi:membrane associated rhomboid family serine protease
VIPIQDAIPSGITPRLTIALIVLNALGFAAQALADSPPGFLLTPFLHPTAVHFLANLLFLWIFGDNVEARLGRVTLAFLYVASGAIGAYAADRLAIAVPPIGASCAISGVLGAYFVLLPKSRVILLVPTPSIVAEAPAVFFLALWWLVQLAGVAVAGSTPPLLWSPVVAFAVGSTIALIARRPIVW